MEIKEILKELELIEKANQDSAKKKAELEVKLYESLVGHTLYLDKGNIVYIYKASKYNITCLQMNKNLIYPKIILSYDDIDEYLWTLDTATKTFNEMLNDYYNIIQKVITINNGKEL